MSNLSTFPNYLLEYTEASLTVGWVYPSWDLPSTQSVLPKTPRRLLSHKGSSLALFSNSGENQDPGILGQTQPLTPDCGCWTHTCPCMFVPRDRSCASTEGHKLRHRGGGSASPHSHPQSLPRAGKGQTGLKSAPGVSRSSTCHITDDQGERKLFLYPLMFSPWGCAS